jgi:hypothetical protein
MPDSSRQSRPPTGWLLVALAVVPLIAFYQIGLRLPLGLTLDLGSLNFPTPRYIRFISLWSVCGSLSIALVALGAARGLPGLDQLARRWDAISDRSFLIATTVAAFAIPLAIRWFVLRGAPLTDDEGAYRFGAELLATGRLWVTSPPLKLFYDQNFMINDVRLYPAYFPGWPALLAPGIWLRSPGIVNPLLSAATVPFLIRLLRPQVGTAWARAGVVLFLASPFLQVTAATELSNTSWLFLLTWALSALVAIEPGDPRLLNHVALSTALAIAFCVRPQSTAPIAIPMLVWWGLKVGRRPRGGRVAPFVAAALPAALVGVMFVGSLWLQTGSPLKPGYVRYAAYMVENDFRFATFTAADITPLAGFDFTHVHLAIARVSSGLLRLNADLFGWPVPFTILPLALAGVANASRWFWSMIVVYVGVMFFQHDWGIDTFGPMHAFELSLPVLVLVTTGFRHLAASQQTGRLAGPVFAALVAIAWIGFAPVRLAAVHQVAEHVNRALEAPEHAGLHHAVVFAPLPFAPRCGLVPGHFVVFRPTNDPDRRNDVLWVNHLDVSRDEQLLETLPGRVGYVLDWRPDCTVRLRPLAGLSSADAPPGRLKP